jgi:hypothetical protein
MSGILDVPQLVEARRRAMWRKLLKNTARARIHKARGPRLRVRRLAGRGGEK